jgi:hypothetical protein
VRFFETNLLPLSLNIGSDKNRHKNPQKKSIITFFLNANLKPEHYAHKPIFCNSVSKLFSGFQFWTFLKMSIFHFPFDFLEPNS